MDTRSVLMDEENAAGYTSLVVLDDEEHERKWAMYNNFSLV